MDSAEFPTAALKREHRLAADESGGVSVSIREAVPGPREVQPVPVVLLHGATFGSAMFDIPVPGYSMQDFLACRGWRNFALDVRGYGRSTPAPILDAEPDANAPYARLEDALADLAAGVRFVTEHTGREAVHVVGFSWGTVIASAFAARYPELTASLVLYAPLYGEVNPLWIDRLADPGQHSRVNPRLGAYRWVTEADIRARWDADIPPGANHEHYREQKVLRAILDSLAAADPGAKDRPEPSFRAPTGALVDLFDVFNGRPLYDPKLISAPTLIIRGHDDTTSTQSDASALFEALATVEKRYVAVSPGSHFLCAERNAVELFTEIDAFLRR